MDETNFEWDEAKNRANLTKHGVCFEDAIRVFADPHMLLFPDRHVDGEERWRACGRVGNIAIMIVAHTYRTNDGQETIRIISARMATRHERHDYERENY